MPAGVAHGQGQHDEVLQEVAGNQPQADAEDRAAQSLLPPQQGQYDTVVLRVRGNANLH